MASQPLVSAEDLRRSPSNKEEPSRTEVLKQLERIANSPLFRNSKRYPAFLRYTVEQTLAGQTDLLKERTLGMQVFGRVSDYDTNADPVVRVTAGEIRKRLAQYYQAAGHEHELRFDFPVGSYIPHFVWPSHVFHPTDDGHAEALAKLEQLALNEHTQPATTSLHAADVGSPWDSQPSHSPALPHAAALPHANVDPPARSRLWLLWALLLASAVFLAVVSAVRFASEQWRDRSSAFFWSPILHSESPTLVVIGVHSLGSDGRDLSPSTYTMMHPKDQESMLNAMTSSDMVPVSDVISYSALINPLGEHGHPFRTQGAAKTTFEQLQHSPLILIGGLDNPWTLRLTSALRFRFGAQQGSVGAIEDSTNPQQVWHFDNAQRSSANSKDYAIVAGFFEPGIEQHVLIAAGIGKSGTAVAAQFLTNPRYMQAWLSHAHLGDHKNVELVLSTEIVEGQEGPPHVVADTSW